jgi:hypothetical protein
MSDAPETSAPAPQPSPPIIHDRPSNKRWLAEGVLVLASVLIGFAVSELGQYRDERGLAESVLRGVRIEVEENEAALTKLESQHSSWETAMAKADITPGKQSAVDVLLASRPSDNATIGVPLKRAAWQMAISSGALRLLDYDVAAALSEIYSFQDLLVENHNRLVSTTLYSTASFERSTSDAAVRMLRGVMSEIAGNEVALLDIYRKHLPLLRRASAD